MAVADRPETRRLSAGDGDDEGQGTWDIEDVYEKTEWEKQTDGKDSDYKDEEHKIGQIVKGFQESVNDFRKSVREFLDDMVESNAMH